MSHFLRKPSFYPLPGRRFSALGFCSTAHLFIAGFHILRSFISGDNKLLVKAFIAYVRPILEYNFIIWSPCLKKDIELLGKVQRRFTKRLQGLKHLK